MSDATVGSEWEATCVQHAGDTVRPRGVVVWAEGSIVKLRHRNGRVQSVSVETLRKKYRNVDREEKDMGAKIVTFAVGTWFTRDNNKRGGRRDGEDEERLTAVDTCVVLGSLPGDRYTMGRVDKIVFGADGRPDLARCVIGRRTPIRWDSIVGNVYTQIPEPRQQMSFVAEAEPPAPPPVVGADREDIEAIRNLLTRIAEATESLVCLWGGQPKGRGGS